MVWKNFFSSKTEDTEEKSDTKEKIGILKPKKEEKVYIIPLGGIDEVGKNMTLIQYRDEILIVDAGLAFPTEELLGIDLVIPDFSYLEKNVEKIKGLVLTHGHEDHIGAIPYLYDKIPNTIPMYGGELTIELAKSKFEKEQAASRIITKTIKGRDIVNIGKYFKVEFIDITHSIADSYSLAITTPAGVIFHTGDFKIDLTPVDEKGVDFFKLAELGEKGVDLMLSDSTNAEMPGFTLSERSVGDAIKYEFSKAKGRIIIAAFASHIHRIQQIVNVAKEYNRKIAIDGRSMLKVFEIGARLGYLKIPENLMVPLKVAEKMPDEEAVILCTGTQGEPLAALSRIAKNMHKHIKIRKNDTVIISATPIPGNEKAVFANINNLLKSEAEVIFEKVSGIHVSGHARQEEQKLMLNLIKPKNFMPVHGEYKMLKKHKELAVEAGVNSENIIIAENGAKIELTKSSFKLVGKVPSGETLVDGLGVGDVGNIVLRDRQLLAQDGIVIIVLNISKEKRELVAGPDIITRGFVYARESENLINETIFRVKEEIDKLNIKNIAEWNTIKNSIRDVASSYLYNQTKRNPIILPIIMEV